MEGAIDFFVSYTEEDEAWAEWIAWQLESVGWKARIMKWDFRPGHNFVLGMHLATRATMTIAVLSPAYEGSRYGDEEWSAALALDKQGRGRRLMPVRIADYQPAGLFAARGYIDLVGKGPQEARKLLMEGVQPGRMKPAQEPGFPGSEEVGSAVRSKPQVEPAFPGTTATPASSDGQSTQAPMPSRTAASHLSPGRLNDRYSRTIPWALGTVAATIVFAVLSVTLPRPSAREPPPRLPTWLVDRFYPAVQEVVHSSRDFQAATQQYLRQPPDSPQAFERQLEDLEAGLTTIKEAMAALPSRVPSQAEIESLPDESGVRRATAVLAAEVGEFRAGYSDVIVPDYDAATDPVAQYSALRRALGPHEAFINGAFPALQKRLDELDAAVLSTVGVPSCHSPNQVSR